jgi:basic membrane protein A
LTELFEGVAEDGLRLARYREIGGLSGALTRRAEHMRQSWTQTEQEVAIQLFLRLVRVGHDGRAARRRLPVQELAGLTELDSVAIAAVVEDLAHHRLISVDRDIPSGPATIEVAHECLFEQWPWLRDVVSTHLAVLRSHDSLQTALAEWEAADRDPDYLLSGGRLEGLMTASRGGALQFTDAEIAFLDACQASAAVAAAKARARSRRQRVRLSIAVATAAGAAAAAAAVLAAPGHSAPPRVAFVQGGDGYIDDLVAQGIDRASRDNRLTLQIEQAGGTNPTAAISQLAQHGENLVLVSADGVDVQDVAAHYPRTRFVDLTGFGSGAHMTDVAFADQQGAFLAGAAATLASKSKRVGFLGGVDIPVIRRFEAGFIAGVHAVDPSAHVLVRFAGRTPESGFRDPALDGMVAREMLRAGVDVLFPAAGQAQFGAVQAVVEYSKKLHRKLWAIGVDEDIYRRTDWERGPNDNTYVLTSMIKRYDVAAYETVRDFIAGTLQSGTRTYDLRNGGMTLAASGGYLAPFQSRLNALRRAIVAGSIVVPCVPPGLTGRAALDASAGPKCP